MVQLNTASVRKKVHIPKVINGYKSELSYPDVNEDHFIHESFRETVFRPKNWSVKQRYDFISFDAEKYKSALNQLIDQSVAKLFVEQPWLQRVC